MKSWGKGEVKRLIGAGAGLIFKGSGFYITDYRSEGYKSSAKTDSSSGNSSSDGSKTSSGSSSSSTSDTKTTASKPSKSTVEKKSSSRPKPIKAT